MATLASQIVGNMASIGVAMSGGAANSNAFGGALGGLAQNAGRAAAAVGQDVRAIASATAGAATAERATLEGVVRAMVGAAAGSQTAGAAVRSGLTATGSTITGVAAQVPSLNTLLAAFLGFEAAKLVFDSVAASIDAAREHIEAYVRIGREAERVGVGTDFFQRATLNAEKLGLETRQVVAALERAREAASVRIGEGEHGANGSAFDRRLEQNVRAGNLGRADREAYDGAGDQEARIRVVLGLIDKLRADQRDLAAFDLAGAFFGGDFERRLRDGVDMTKALRETLDSTATTVAGVRIVGADEVERAAQLDARAKDIADTFATALAPLQRDFSNAVLDTYSAFLDVERVIARVVTIAMDLYNQVKGIVGQVRGLVASIPGIGKIVTAGNPVSFLTELGRATGAVEPEAQGPPAPLTVRVRPHGPDRSAALPALTPHRARGGGGEARESLDAVETLINQLEKARDTAKAELDNVGKTNVEREKAVALAKAEAAAREDVKRGRRADPNLDADERARVLGAAEAMQRFRDRTEDAQQQLRQTAEAARGFADAVSNGLADAIVNGRSFSSVLSDIAKQIERGALQALLTGQGPLAGLFGTAPAASAGGNALGGLAGLATGLSGGAGTGSSAGGLMGGLMGGLLGGSGGGVGGLFASLFRANGGPVSAGTPYTVGEMGRELFVPGQDGRIVPLGPAGAGGPQAVDNSRTYTIDARGAQAGVAEQIAAALTTYDRGLDRALSGRVDRSRARYGPAR
ncbi:hypothetical protein [Methylobacterium sp. D54C]